MGRPAINLTNQKFGKLTVIKRTENAKDGHARWLCQCDCGNTIIVNSNVLKKGHTLSCGCWRREAASLKAKQSYKDLINQKFGKLTVKEFLGSNNKGAILWRCECDCGNKNFITTSHHLISGNTKSCGCLISIGEANIIKILINNNIEFIPQKIFKQSALLRKEIIQDSLYNLALLPKRENIQKGENRLKDVEDQWLKLQIVTYECIPENMFEEFSNVNNYQALFDYRKQNFFDQAFGDNRDNLLNN